MRVTTVSAAVALLLGLAAGPRPHINRSVRTVVIPPDAPISVRATVGDLTVTGWDRPDVEVEIVRSAPTESEVAAMTAVIDRDDAGLHVTAVQAGEGRDARLRGSVVVHVPVDQPIGSLELFEGTIALLHLRGGVRGAVEHGSIAAIALSGAIRLETVIGDIRVQNAELTDRGPIRLRAFNGNVDLSLATKPADARILALSLNGAVRSDIPLHVKAGFGPRFGEATLGLGMPVVSIDVVNGDISIAHGVE